MSVDRFSRVLRPLCRTACEPAAAALVLALVAAAPNAFAAPPPPKRLLLINDPTDTSRATRLLVAAMCDQIDHTDGYTVIDTVKPTPREARAMRRVDRANDLRRSAREQFETLELDAALRDYNRALQKLQRSVALAGDIRPLEDTLSMLAATYLLVGQEKRARSLIAQVLVLNTRYRPSQGVFNPQMMQVFNAVVSEVQAKDGVPVNITTDPPGAAVQFDGRFVGFAPLKLERVLPGRHYVRAALPASDTLGRTLEVKGRGPQETTLHLSPSRRDRGTKLVKAALNAIEDTTLPRVAKTMAAASRADMVLLLAPVSDRYLLAAYDLASGKRTERTATSEIDTVSEARHAATQLLGWVSGPTEPAATPTVAEEAPSGSTGAANASTGGAAAGHPGAGGAANTEVAAATSAAPGGAGTTFGSAPTSGFHLFSTNRTKEYTLYGLYGGAAACAVVAGIFGGLALESKALYYRETPLPTGGKDDPARTTDQIEGKPIAKTGRERARMSDIFWGITAAAALSGLAVEFLWKPGAARATTDSGVWNPGTPGSAAGKGNSKATHKSKGDGDDTWKAGPAAPKGTGWDLFIGPGVLRLRF